MPETTLLCDVYINLTILMLPEEGL